MSAWHSHPAYDDGALRSARTSPPLLHSAQGHHARIRIDEEGRLMLFPIASAGDIVITVVEQAARE